MFCVTGRVVTDVSKDETVITDISCCDEASTVQTESILVFWILMLCSSVDRLRCYGRTYCLHMKRFRIPRRNGSSQSPKAKPLHSFKTPGSNNANILSKLYKYTRRPTDIVWYPLWHRSATHGLMVLAPIQLSLFTVGVTQSHKHNVWGKGRFFKNIIIGGKYSYHLALQRAAQNSKFNCTHSLHRRSMEVRFHVPSALLTLSVPQNAKCNCQVVTRTYVSVPQCPVWHWT
jgi:hypothetical protein